MLQIKWSTLLLQILNFTVMAFILWRFFFRSVVRILDERSKRVGSALEEAEKSQQQAEEMRAEYEEKLTEAQEQVISMRQTAQEELARTKRQLLEETRDEIQDMREKAQREIEEARQQAVYQHRRELGRLVTALSARMIRESGGEAFQEASIDRFIAQLAALPEDEYRQTLEGSDAEVVHAQLVSAQPLSDAAMTRIAERMRQMAGQPVEVKRQVDASLVAGATIRFGDTMIDGSLAGQLQHLKERYVAELEQGQV
jgi:F-type H+-transporting ATPase subunit b